MRKYVRKRTVGVRNRTYFACVWEKMCSFVGGKKKNGNADFRTFKYTKKQQSVY